MPTATTRRLILLAGVAIYWGLLFVATHWPGDGQLHLPHPIPHLDKLVHAAGFAGLAVFVCAAASGWWRPGPAMYLAVIGLLAAYAGLDEFSQGFVRLRQSDVRDWIADLIGTLAGVGLFALVHHLVTARRTTAGA
jgi:VanZ family protein